MSENFNRNYPKGRLNGDDDGEFTYGIAADTKNFRVLINFFKPMQWIGLDVDSGIALLTALAKSLTEISGIVIRVEIGPRYTETCIDHDPMYGSHITKTRLE